MYLNSPDSLRVNTLIKWINGHLKIKDYHLIKRANMNFIAVMQLTVCVPRKEEEFLDKWKMAKTGNCQGSLEQPHFIQQTVEHTGTQQDVPHVMF
jgi:hypothetical protein